jgi:long-subunit fatty acid transport protein
MFGFAAPVGSRLVLGVTISDFLNRNWDVQQSDTVMPRDSALAVTDRTRSVGGVSDLRFGAAYRISQRIAVGVGFHVLTGSARTAVERAFPSDTVYRTFAQVTETDYHGLGMSVGLLITPVPQVVVGVSARTNGRLSASNPGGSARVHLPTELSAGLYVTLADGVLVSSTVGHANWSVAAPDLQAEGQPPSHDVWNVGLGAEVALVRMFGRVTPLRAGYRWRQLPFPVATDTLNLHASALTERAVSAGLTFALGSGRANLDLGLDVGSRTAGALTERFTTLLVGFSIYP